MNENVIEFLRDEKQATTTFSQRRFIHEIKEYAKTYPDECKIMAENDDGSIVAHIPTNWIKIRPPRKVDMSEERRNELRERFNKIRKDKKKYENE